jgi:hypothetical protein
MPGRNWSLRQAQRQGNQGWTPGNAIEILHGPPYGRGVLTDRLAMPLDPSNIDAGLAAAGIQSQTNIEIRWASTTLNNASADQVVQAYPNRVVLVVQNQSSTTAIAVNFDQVALIFGTSPNQTSQGIMLLPGVSLYIDRWCPTGTIHVTASNVAVPVIQGLSAIGNVPELQLLVAIQELTAEIRALRGA